MVRYHLSTQLALYIFMATHFSHCIISKIYEIIFLSKNARSVKARRQPFYWQPIIGFARGALETDWVLSYNVPRVKDRVCKSVKRLVFRKFFSNHVWKKVQRIVKENCSSFVSFSGKTRLKLKSIGTSIIALGWPLLNRYAHSLLKLMLRTYKGFLICLYLKVDKIESIAENLLSGDPWEIFLWPGALELLH